jgi:hypothetical protein
VLRLQGLNVHRLKLYLNQKMKPSDVNYTDNLLWSKQGDQGGVWRNAQIQLQSKSMYRLIFEVQRDRNYLGDIAVDDVSLFDGSCVQNHNKYHRCDFEDSKMCDYKWESSPMVPWMRYSTGIAYLMSSTTPNGLSPGFDNTVSIIII